jgi:hypothetical protein
VTTVRRCPNGEIGVPYSQTVVGAGGTTPYAWTVTTGSLPGGLSLDGSTGSVSGTPTVAGASSFSLSVVDGAGGTATQSYTITVLADPSVSTAILPNAEIGVPYSQTLLGSGGTAPYSWSVTGGSLPTGLSLDGSTGVISGTPTGVGSPTFTITLTDAVGQTAAQGYTVTIVAAPSVTTTTLPDAEIGVPYSQTLLGSGGTTPYAWSVTVGSLPAGLSLDSSTGVISGTPSAGGAPTFTVTFTDAAGGTATQTYTLTVLVGPSVTTATLPDGEVGVPYSQTVVGSGGSTPYAWSVTAGSLPAGLTLDSSTGIISGTPSTAGAPTFTVTLTDATRKTATQSYTVTILAAPSVTSATLPDAEIGVPYSQTLLGSGGTAPYSWSVTGGSLPTGLSLDGSTGVISGAPSTAGSPTFTITLTDAVGQTAAQGYTVTIVAAPSVTATSLPDGEIGVPYSQTLLGSGGTTPYAWSVTVGTLPAGLSLNRSTGLVSGTPSASSAPIFTVTLADAAGGTASQSLMLTVLAGPSVILATLPRGEVGIAYSQTFVGSGGTTPYAWSVTVGSLPTGLALDSSTGAISGTPSMAGSPTFTVTLTDADSQTASESYTLTVLVAVSVTTATLPHGEVGVGYSQTLVGTGGSAPYGWSVTAGSLPAGLTLAGSTGVISGTPTAGGAPTFTVTLTDAHGGIATAGYALVVQAGPSVTTASLPNGEVGVAYNQTVTGSGGTNPKSWAVTTGALPAGLSLAGSTGVISGTPTAVGSAAFTVTLTDAVGGAATQIYTVIVLASPSVMTTTLPDGEIGVLYSQTLIGSGGTTPYTWAVTAGSLPAGLSFNNSSVTISGTPSSVGSPALTVTLTDAEDQTFSQSYTLTIVADPSLLTTTLPDGQVGVAYSQTLLSNGGTTPFSWSLTGGSLPGGLALDSSTGVISGTPLTASTPTFVFTVTLTDAGNQTATQSYTLTVEAASPVPPGAAPSVITVTLPNGEVGVAYSQTVVGAGGTTPYAWTVTTGSLPAGLALNEVTGVISGTPSSTGPPTFTVTLTDANNSASSQIFTLTVVMSSSLNSRPIATTPNGDGYWLVASDGGVFAFGNAAFHGSMGGQHLNKPVVGISIAAGGSGYWLVASDGGIFAFGDAFFYGSMGGQHLAEPVVGMAAIPSGTGYWLVASDGGVFTYGAAVFYGSHAYGQLNQPMTGIDPTPNGLGYWLVAADGGVFTYGDAVFYGSTPSI